jgi:hypothetical protein
MPDPILNLADFAHAAEFKLAGHKGRVIPQFMQAGSSHHHTRYFYVEHPGPTGQVYQIDAARLVAVIGDGGIRRHFKAMEVAIILSGLSHRLDHPAFLKSISLAS